MCPYKYGPEKIKHSGPGQAIVVQLQPKLLNEIKYGGSYLALQAPVTGRCLKAFGIGPAQLAMYYSFYFCRFGIYLNLTICSNSKMFQFETIQIRNYSLSKMFRFETCSNPKICWNPKTVQNLKYVPFKICSIWNMFKFENLFHLKYVQIWKSVPFKICSIWNMFKFENLFHWNLFHLKYVQI
jgi:hypothetical protein